MNSVILALAGLLAAGGLLGGCATSPPRSGRMDVTSDEVAAYVRDNWSTFQEEVARRARQPDEKPALVRVRSVSCQSYDGYPHCTVDVTVRFGSEAPAESTFFAMFKRGEDGGLMNTFILIEEPRRR